MSEYVDIWGLDIGRWAREGTPGRGNIYLPVYVNDCFATWFAEWLVNINGVNLFWSLGLKSFNNNNTKKMKSLILTEKRMKQVLIVFPHLAWNVFMRKLGRKNLKVKEIITVFLFHQSFLVFFYSFWSIIFLVFCFIIFFFFSLFFFPSQIPPLSFTSIVSLSQRPLPPEHAKETHISSFYLLTNTIKSVSPYFYFIQTILFFIFLVQFIYLLLYHISCLSFFSFLFPQCILFSFLFSFLFLLLYIFLIMGFFLTFLISCFPSHITTSSTFVVRKLTIQQTRYLYFHGGSLYNVFSLPSKVL